MQSAEGNFRLVAMANLGHEIGRGTIANILREYGIDPTPERDKHMPWFDALLVQPMRKCDGGGARPSRRRCRTLRHLGSFVGLDFVHALRSDNCRSGIVVGFL